ncbi:MAG: hypothetical protein PVG66_02165 [Chromatiales bacterium]
MRKKRANSHRKASALLLCAVLVSSCAPVVKHYYEPDLKGAKLKYDIHWKQPRLETDLAQGAILSVSGSFNLSETGPHELWFNIWFIVPKGVTVNLLSSEILIAGPNGYSKLVRIDHLLGQGPLQRNLPYDPTDALVGESLPSKVPPLFGSECMSHNYYAFYHSVSTSVVFEQFSITLPPLLVNGERIEAKTIKFRKTSGLSVETI